MIERVLELIRVKKISPSQLADAIGVQRSGISHLVSGRNKPSLEFITRILTFFPDVNPDWLLFGKKPIFRNGSITDLELTGELHAFEDKHLKSGPDFKSQTSIGEELFGKEEIFNEKQLHTEDQLVEDKISEHEIKGSADAPLLKKGKEKLLTSLTKEAGGKKAERIVILYTDRTFGEFFPE